MSFQIIKSISKVFVGLLLCTAINTAYADIELDRAEGIAWLLQNQNGDGSWGYGSAKVAATSEALEALRNSGADHGFIYSRALSWLANTKTDSVDSLSRKIIALENAGLNSQKMGFVDELQKSSTVGWAYGLLPSGWGAYKGHEPSFPDSSLAMEAIRLSLDPARYVDTVKFENYKTNFVDLIKVSQNEGNYGWNYSSYNYGLYDYPSMIIPTAYNLIALQAYATDAVPGRCSLYPTYSCEPDVPVSPIILRAVNWLLNDKLQNNGAFLDHPDDAAGAVYKTALAYLGIDAVRVAGIEPSGVTTVLANARAFILEQQQDDGGWNSDAFQTALALRTFPATTMIDTDVDGIPDVVEPILELNPLVADSRSLIPENGFDPDGVAASKISVLPIVVETIRDQIFTFTPNITGASPGFTWSEVSGSLPNWLSLQSTSMGTVGGTPTVAGSYSFKLMVQDAAGVSLIVPGHIRVIAPDDMETDTDGDGISSSVELSSGTDALDSNSVPVISNTAPVAMDDSYSVDVNANPVALAILVNDTDHEDDIPYINTVGEASAGGKIIINGNGDKVLYTPAANYVGSETFSYTVSDGKDESNTATVTVTVAAVINEAPSVVNDSYTVAEDSTNTLLNVLENDGDEDDPSLNFTIVSAPSASGIVTINAIGDGLLYSPVTDFNGTETFSYTVTDGRGGNGTATVSVIVTASNDAPIANDDIQSVRKGSSSILIPVLANDIDIDGDNINISAADVTGTAGGVIEISANGKSLIYSPVADYVGTETFTYTVTDGLQSATAMVKTTMLEVELPDGTAQVASGQYHTVILKQDGTVWAWGYNTYCQLGDGTTDPHYYPVQVMDADGQPLSGVTAISAGWRHTVALKQDGSVWAWGSNSMGQLGNATVSSSCSPVQVLDSTEQPITGVYAIEAGNLHTHALKQGGALWSWGYNSNAQLGLGASGIPVFYPVQTLEAGGQPFVGVSAISADAGFMVALKQDGSVWAWGNGSGNPTEVLDVAGQSLTGVSAVAAGGMHGLVLKQDGSVWSWGWNTTGQLGNGTYSDRSYADHVLDAEGQPLSGAAAISAGGYHSKVLKLDGSVWSWGPNYNGQLGDGATSGSPYPVQVIVAQDLPLMEVSSISAGINWGGHTVALKQDGSVWSWGLNTYGQLGDGTTNNSNHAVKVLGSSSGEPFYFAQFDINNVTVIDDNYSVDENSKNALLTVLDNDADMDGGNLTISAVSGGSAGGVTDISATGDSVLYSPKTNYVGTETFSYVVNNNSGSSETAMVTVVVTAVNDAPVANDDSYALVDGSSTLLAVLTNDTDIDGGALNISAVSQGMNGSVSVAAGGKLVSYTPNANFYEQDSFSYTVNDGRGGSDTAIVTINGQNNAPTADPDAVAVNEDDGSLDITATLLDGDQDSDGDDLRISSIDAFGAQGRVTLNAGVVSYDPNRQFEHLANGVSATDSFSYTLSDGNGGSATAMVVVTINGQNDAPLVIPLGDQSGAEEEFISLVVNASDVR